MADFIRSERSAGIGDNSDFEKRRAARYGLNDPDGDFYDYERTEDIRFRWRLTKVKMRVPFSTSGIR